MNLLVDSSIVDGINSGTNGPAGYPALRFFLGFFFVRVVAFFDGLRFRHVFSLLSLAVPAAALHVVNVRFTVHPHHACSASGSDSVGRRRGCSHR